MSRLLRLFLKSTFKMFMYFAVVIFFPQKGFLWASRDGK